jgi:hypothetical protein
MTDQVDENGTTSELSKSGSQDNVNGEELKSYAGVTGEWETRQISIMGVVKRFISQLSYGQDLTKISMPSEFLNPYSVLEFVSLRYLTRIPILLEANEHAEPHYRMLHVIRWFLTSLVEAKMYKKPYNPVVCETHSCYIENNGGNTHFIGEQVSHHPPVSAMHVRNDDAGVSLQGTISFGVKFWLNSVTVNTNGYVSVKMAKHGDEEYVFEKALPDLNLKNVVFGTRRMRWSGTIRVVCKKTNCEAEIKFDQSGNDETVSGSISCDGEPSLSFDGSLDSEVLYQDDDDEQLLFSSEQVAAPTIIIPPQTDTYPSLKVWKDVSKNIIANNMTEADKAKTIVEDEQRVRTRAGEDLKKERKYFIFNEEQNRWVYKEGSYTPNS